MTDPITSGASSSKRPRARTCACWKRTLLQQQGKGPATVAMVKLASCCELAPLPPHFPWCSTALSKIHLHISPLPLRLPVHPSVSPHAGHRFSSPQFFCHPFVFPASSFPSLPHLSFMPQWPPHGPQTEPECDLHASSRADWPEAGGSTTPNITTQNPDIDMQQSVVRAIDHTLLDVNKVGLVFPFIIDRNE